MKATATTPPPSALMNKLLKEAVRLLNSARIPFAILLPDGEKIGELEISTKRKRGDPKCNYRHTGYMEIIDKMKPGQVHVFETPEMMSPQGYRSCIAAKASTAWGKGNQLTTVTDRNVEIMRLEEEQS